MVGTGEMPSSIWVCVGSLTSSLELIQFCHVSTGKTVLFTNPIFNHSYVSLVCLMSQWHLHCWIPLPGLCDPTHTLQGPPNSLAISFQSPLWPPFPLSIALLCYLCLTLCAPSSTSGFSNPGLAGALGLCGCLN